MRIPGRSVSILLAHLPPRLTRFGDFLHAQCSEEIPSTFFGEAGPVGAGVLPQQSPEEQDVTLPDGVERGSSEVRAIVSVSQVGPVRIGVRIELRHTAQEREA
jgi:hypothetical protein